MITLKRLNFDLTYDEAKDMIADLQAQLEKPEFYDGQIVEVTDLDRCFVVCAFKYLYPFGRKILVKQFFGLFGDGDILNGRSTFVFEPRIADITLSQFCRLGKHTEEFVGAHIGLFDLEYEEVPLSGEAVERDLLYEKTFNGLFEVKGDRGMFIGIVSGCIHRREYSKNVL